MRVLLVTRNLPPLVGGMERLNWHMAEELASRAELRVVGPAGSANLAPAEVRVQEVPLKPLSRFLGGALWQALRIAHNWRPNLIIAGSGLAALPVLLAARFAGARAAAYVHGLDLTVPHPVYRYLWLPALRSMDRVIANSRATRALAETAGVERARISVVCPGVQLPSNSYNPKAVTEFRAEYDLDEKLVLLSVGRLSTRKGLREFVIHAMPRIVKAQPRAMLLIVGDAPTDALHAHAQTPASIRDSAERAGVSEHIRFLGQVTDYAKLGIIYSAADVHVFPVRDIPGDPEGFGMVAVEAAAHGLPTVAFATGGVADAIADGQSGRLVKAGDYAAFADEVLNTLVRGKIWSDGCKEFAQGFAWSTFGDGLADALLGNVAAMRQGNSDGHAA